MAAAALFVWLVFAFWAGEPFRSTAGSVTILNSAAPLGILAVAVALLMIGGEFDLSVGSIIGATGMSIMVLTTHFGWSVWPALTATLFLAVAIGLVNGLLVVRTGLPSFIVTLGTLFILRGLAIAIPRAATGRTQLGGLDDVAGYESARALWGSAPFGSVRVSVLYWAALALLGSWVLFRTRMGNWILAAGGNAESAAKLGVPVRRVKVGLFVATALAAYLVAVTQVLRFDGADALRGQLQEFRAIIAVVIGGTLLSGGYGSAIGALFGALIYGMVQQGIVLAGVDADWFQVFLGVMLMVAVVFNDSARKRIGRR